jgi:hypothetical protein
MGLAVNTRTDVPFVSERSGVLKPKGADRSRRLLKLKQYYLTYAFSLLPAETFTVLAAAI